MAARGALVALVLAVALASAGGASAARLLRTTRGQRDGQALPSASDLQPYPGYQTQILPAADGGIFVTPTGAAPLDPSSLRASAADAGAWAAVPLRSVPNTIPKERAFAPFRAAGAMEAAAMGPATTTDVNGRGE